ncbi:DNA translocase FtsK [Candidatus Gracilibacteria bacterium]|nr:DNA translocase FtsK [Candidatus Gracilibacteria bacterium]MCF7898445.1 DNA translocase FtsK [Candidatus Paceibacterota bacterium]
MAKDDIELDSRTRRRRVKEPVLTETILGVLAVVAVMIGVLLIFSMVHAGGTGGEILFSGLYSIIGVLSYLTPIMCFYIAYYLWKEEVPEIRFITSTGALLLVLGVIGLGTLLFSSTNFGGALGTLLTAPLIKYFALYPSIALLGGVTFIGGIIILERKPSLVPLMTVLMYPFLQIKALIMARKMRSFDDEDVPLNTEGDEVLDEEIIEDVIDEPIFEEDISTDNLRREIFGKLSPEDLVKKTKKEVVVKPIILTPSFVPPPFDLLNLDSGKSGAGDSRAKMTTIQHTLKNFKIHVEMGEVTVGPTVTQFTLKPAQGVNLSKIVALHDNLAMELGSEYLRIEAPIPGKTLVGIEIPNERKTLLGLRSMLELDEFMDAPQLTVAIGKSIIGKPVFGNLEKMPHLLVAGATRTGKSITLQNILISLLYKNSPYDLKLIILDPKRVEFTAYHNLPHLYTPVIKEPKGAIKALNWAIQEMERRYEILAEHGQVNVSDYNKKVLSPALEKASKKGKIGDELTGIPPKMPYIVIIFDEYNDFMLSYPKEISPLITALSQKGRAAGVHLILATQRPDVKVITGTIKANIPARIALKTTSQIDSRTILDSSGAEDLLGNGDMLYMASDNPRLVRIQAPFISVEEIKAVITHIKQDNVDFIPEHVDLKSVKTGVANGSTYEDGGDQGAEPEDDEDYMSAKDYVISTGKASTSSLQTAFRWGYNKAARIVNDLERFGVIGPSRQGERYREILSGNNSSDESTQEDTAEDKSVEDLFRA